MGITIPVAFRSSGNVILNKMISFQIYQDGDAFIAAPLINTEERRLADLPLEMAFERHAGIFTSMGTAERNTEVLKTIFQKVSLEGPI